MSDIILEKVIPQFEAVVGKLNSIRGTGPLGKLQVDVLGQMGLLIRPHIVSELVLVATVDFDGGLNGEPPLEDLFKKALRENGLSYDEQSRYIWLPKETTREVLYDSDILKVTSPLPIYLIVSKAVKAPEKNKELVRDAIVLYGDELLHLLEIYNVRIDFFLEEAE